MKCTITLRRFTLAWLIATAFFAFILAGAGQPARAGTSDAVIAFQGAVAVKPGQAPLDTNLYAAQFSLWTAATGGTSVWTELRNITISNGIYRVELGEFTPLPADLFTINNDLWLQIEINLTRHGGLPDVGDVFNPRQHLTMVPYADIANAAFVAGTAGELSHLNSAGTAVVESAIVGTDDGELVTRNSAGNINGELGSVDEEGVAVLSEANGNIRASLSSLLGQGDLYLINSSDNFAATLTSNDEGEFQLNNSIGDARVYLYSFDDNGFLSLADSGGNAIVTLDAFYGPDNPTGNALEVDGNVEISGDMLVQGTKNFSIPYPGDPSRRIIYASLEGPEAAAYVRGTGKLVGGEAIIDLPEHFAKIVAPQGLTVQLTPRDAGSYGLATAAITPTRLHVKELMRGTGSYEFDYVVTGVRLGYEKYEAVRSAKTARTTGAGRVPAAVEANPRDEVRRQALERIRTRAANRPLATPAPQRAGADSLNARMGAIQR